MKSDYPTVKQSKLTVCLCTLSLNKSDHIADFLITCNNV